MRALAEIEHETSLFCVKEIMKAWGYTYLIDGVAVDLTDIVGSWLSLLNHLECDGGKDAVLPALPAKFLAATLAILRVAVFLVVEACGPAEARPAAHILSWLEEACILTRELSNIKAIDLDLAREDNYPDLPLLM